VLQVSLRPAAWSLDFEARYEHLDSVEQVGTRWSVAVAPCIWTGSGSGLGFCPVLMGGVLSITETSGAGE